jgi:hypothetical protein
VKITHEKTEKTESVSWLTRRTGFLGLGSIHAILTVSQVFMIRNAEK